MYYLQKLLCGMFGALLVLLGITLPHYWSAVVMSYVKRDLALSPTSRSHDLWKGTPVPITMKLYFWNWTNPDQLMANVKPAFTEMGPYCFNEVHEKVNVTWNDNGTVTFQMVRKWYFDQENSNGTLDDQVTTLNVVALTAASIVRHWSYFFRSSLSLTLTTTGQNVSVTKRVGELLFEGYRDSLIDIAMTMPQFAGVEIPFDRFGWFYKMNDSTLLDGVFTMDTGKKDISRLGATTAWNYQNTTRFFSPECAAVSGSAGELFPPGLIRHEPITMFSAEICRSVTFGYSGEQVVQGITGYRYSGGKEMIDNGTQVPGNECFCGGDCLPSGVMNLTACRYGAPGFSSFPHFHLADPYYRHMVDGMRPDPDQHTFYLTLEPTIGIPLDARARLQVNILLQPIDGVSLYSDVPKVMIPMMWFEQSATLTDSLAFELRLVLALLAADVYVSCVLVALGLSLLTYVVVTAFLVKRQNSGVSLVNSMDELESLKNGKTKMAAIIKT